MQCLSRERNCTSVRMHFYGLLVLSLISAMIESKPLNKTNDLEKESAFRTAENSIDQKLENADATTEENATIKPQSDNILNSLLPILNRWKFTPQTFLQDRLNLLKQTLGNYGVVVPSNNATISKQLTATNGLLNLVGLNDSGFYTDRFEPAGFFGGNGWFANKGGILGGPGAILSTGSLLTDYPTPYRK